MQKRSTAVEDTVKQDLKSIAGNINTAVTNPHFNPVVEILLDFLGSYLVQGRRLRKTLE